MSLLQFLRAETLGPLFAPFGANEMFTSSLLAWALQHDDAVRARFLAQVSTPRDPATAPGHSATISALTEADDIEVTVESYATVGNIDIAMFSRQANAVLLIENKTGAALSAHQVTKYRDALALAAPGDPSDRKLATAVLCPLKDLHGITPGSWPGEVPEKGFGAFRNDWSGVGASAVVPHEHLLESVYRPALAAMGDGRDLGQVLLSAAWRHLEGRADASTTDQRAAFFHHLKENWALERYEPQAAEKASIRLAARKSESSDLKVSIGTSSRSMLTIEFGGRRYLRPKNEPTPEQQVLLRYLRHLEVEKPKGSKTVPVPTPYPVFHTDKPWLGTDTARWDEQAAVLQRVLDGLEGLVSSTPASDT